jgi:hypothetical protein
MKKIIILLLFALLALHTPLLFAKRAYIEYPDKISIGAIEYKASYAYSLLAQKTYIEAKNINTKETLWKKEIYKIVLNPRLERDVQLIMITEIKEKGNKLLIYNEKKEKYSLDLKTLKVKKLIL